MESRDSRNIKYVRAGVEGRWVHEGLNCQGCNSSRAVRSANERGGVSHTLRERASEVD